jgi:hypothetical protein
MTKVPTVIVEGIDDMQVYDDIAKSAGVKVSILASELIKPNKAGCDGVKELMASIDDLPQRKYNLSKYVVGIIDKDVCDFRGEIEPYNCLFTLRYYSMESHYICKTNLLRTIKRSTKVTSELLNSDLEEKVTDMLISSFERLYYASLEALSHSLDKDYQAEFSYSNKIARVYCDNSLYAKIEAKKETLTHLASNHEICFSLESMRKFIKGKWLMEIYTRELEKVIKSLPDLCGSDMVAACSFCIGGVEDKCSYIAKETLSKATIKHLIMDDVSSCNFDYIRDKFNSLIQ